jgi:hypothetical protein
MASAPYPRDSSQGESRTSRRGPYPPEPRLTFALRFPIEEELSNAVTNFGSWHRVVNEALRGGPGLPRRPGRVDLAKPKPKPKPKP